MWANGKENGRLIMTKLDILCELHAVIAARLFGEGPWLMEREDALLTGQRVFRSRALLCLDTMPTPYPGAEGSG